MRLQVLSSSLATVSHSRLMVQAIQGTSASNMGCNCHCHCPYRSLSLPAWAMEDYLNELHDQYVQERRAENCEPATFRNWKKQWFRSRENYDKAGVPHPHPSMQSTATCSVLQHLEVFHLSAFPAKALGRASFQKSGAPHVDQKTGSLISGTPTL